MKGRRDFLRAAGTGIGGFAVVGAATNPAAAAKSKSITLQGGAGGGDYYITIDDSSPVAGSDVESDQVTCHDGLPEGALDGRLRGHVESGEYDTYYFDGTIRSIKVFNNVYGYVDGAGDRDTSADLIWKGTGNYSMEFATDPRVTKNPSCESSDTSGYGTCGGSVGGSDDKDGFTVWGGDISYFELHSPDCGTALFARYDLQG